MAFPASLCDRQRSVGESKLSRPAKFAVVVALGAAVGTIGFYSTGSEVPHHGNDLGKATSKAFMTRPMFAVSSSKAWVNKVVPATPAMSDYFLLKSGSSEADAYMLAKLEGQIAKQRKENDELAMKLSLLRSQIQYTVKEPQRTFSFTSTHFFGILVGMVSMAVAFSAVWAAIQKHHVTSPVSARPRSAVSMTLSTGDDVLVVGKGPVMLLAAKLAASKGFKTSCLVGATDDAMAEDLVGDSTLPLTLLPITGDDADASKIEAAVASASGLVIAFDGEEVPQQKALNVYMPATGKKLKRVSILSRHLNGEGMGFFAQASKAGANSEVWAAGGKAVAGYKDFESRVKTRAAEVGAAYTIVRAGTLKGGGSGDPIGDGGDSSFLSGEVFYNMGQKDVVNWRMLFDCDTLGVTLKRGDCMPGPGFTAALSATSPDSHDGDSGRGGVAAALVEALRIDSAANADFGVGTAKSRTSPSEEEWKELFAAA